MKSIIIAVLSLLLVSTSLAAPDLARTERQALLEYARACLIARISGNAPPRPPDCAVNRQRACFVTFFEDRRVFACFGGFSPRRSNLAAEIDENVRLALQNDGRARSVTMETASRAGIQITFPLGQPERVDSHRSIDPAREGMLVEGADGGVAFVPGEARTARWAFRQALTRLNENDPAAVTVYRFRAEAISTRQFPK